MLISQLVIQSVRRKTGKFNKEAQEIRKKDLETDSANYYNDRFYNLSNFISNKLSSTFFKNRNAKIIVNHFMKFFHIWLGQMQQHL